MQIAFFENAEKADIPEAMLNLWARLAAGTGQADPVCCGPAWQLAWHATCSPRLPFMTAREGENIAVFSVAKVGKGKAALMPLETEWFFGKPLLGEDSLDLLEAVIAETRRLLRPAAIFPVVSALQRGDALRKRLLAQFGSLEVALYREFSEGAASLAGGVDGWLGRRSANHRQKLKKAMRRGRELGIAFTRHVPATKEEADALYDQILAIETTSWKGLAGNGITMSPGREFYREFMRRQADHGTVRVILAWLEGKPAGYIFGSVLGKTYRGQQFSYNQEYANLSIGNLMQLQKVQWLCEEGIERYDMGPVTGPKMAYKEHWTEIRLPVETWLLGNPFL